MGVMGEGEAVAPGQYAPLLGGAGAAYVPVAGPGGSTPGYSGASSAPFNPVAPMRGRRAADVGYAVAYVVLLVMSVFFMGYGAGHANKDYGSLASAEALQRAATCDADANGIQRYSAGAAALAAMDDEDVNADHFFSQARWWLLVTALGAVLLGAAFLALVASHPRFMVKATLGTQGLLMAMGALAALAHGVLFVGILYGVFAACLLALLFMWPPQLEKLSQLLGVAGRGVKENPGLCFVAVGIKAGLVVLLTVHVVAITLGLANGRPVQAEGAIVDTGSSGLCHDAMGQAVDCCRWELDSWVPFGFAVAAFSGLWSIMVAYDIKVFTVAGSIGQWYYTPEGYPTVGTTLGTLRAALTSSFGSICFGALILTFIEILRSMMRQARRDARNGAAAILACLMECIFACVASIIEFLSKFAIIECALTGLAFWPAAQQVTSMLKRHFGMTYTVWWLPPFVLNFSVMMLAVGYGICVGLFSGPAFDGDANKTNEQVLLGVIAGLAALLVMGFFASLVLNAVDTVFACYAHDVDANKISKQYVHEVYAVIVPVTTQPVPSV